MLLYLCYPRVSISPLFNTKEFCEAEHNTWMVAAKGYMLKQVYLPLASWMVCEVQAKCCVFPCINLICSGTSDYLRNKIIGEKI